MPSHLFLRDGGLSGTSYDNLAELFSPHPHQDIDLSSTIPTKPLDQFKPSAARVWI
jgi:hypothetical protein